MEVMADIYHNWPDMAIFQLSMGTLPSLPEGKKVAQFTAGDVDPDPGCIGAQAPLWRAPDALSEMCGGHGENRLGGPCPPKRLVVGG